MARFGGLRKVVALLALSGMLTACSSLGGEGTNPGGQPKGKESTPTVEAAPLAAFSKPDPKLVKHETAILKSGGINATAMLVDREMPGLAYALDIVRGQVLRQHAWDGGGKLTVTPALVGSSSKAVAVAYNADGKGGKHTAMVYYDPKSNTSYSSTALIAPEKWAEFTKLVGEKAGDHSGEATKALASPTWPNGNGPAIAFSKEGNLVVQFQGGKVSNIVLEEKEVTPLLTELGVRAKAASVYPTAAETPATFGPAAETLVGALTGKDPRPQLTLGTDCTKKKCIALTFDDGPAPETADLVAELTKEKVPATFFVLGTSADSYPDVVTKTSAAGMEMASHNQIHNAMTTVSDDGLAKQVARSRTTLRKLAGTDPLFLRPPYGDRNKRVDGIIGKNNMAVAIWSVDTLDWKHRTTASIVGYVGQQSSPGGVVLMHDIHATSRAAVPSVIAKLKADGYTLVTLAELGPEAYRFGKPFCTTPRDKACMG